MMQLAELSSRARCECHDCTQARLKMSSFGQFQTGAIGGTALGRSEQKQCADQALAQQKAYPVDRPY